MNRESKLFSVKIGILVFSLCFVARLAEYFLLRTEETIFAVNFIHKIWGFGIILLCLLVTDWKWENIGFKRPHMLFHILMGIGLAFTAFMIGYGLEMNLLKQLGKTPQMQFFVTGFSLNGYRLEKTEMAFMISCILFNVLNVLMEEGVFRGILFKLGQQRNHFWKVNLTSATLFGIWYLVGPIKEFVDGDIRPVPFLLKASIYMLFSVLMGLKYGMLYDITGAVWAGMGEHFFHNVVASQLIHVVTTAGMDELLLLRIVAAQVVSCGIVFWLHNRSRKSEMNQVVHTLYESNCSYRKSA